MAEVPQQMLDEFLSSGERYVPGMRGRIEAEHMCRYLWARSFVGGKSVLDVACGSGYGTKIFACDAANVIGVDLDERVVNYAKQTYAAPNVEFRQASILELPFDNGSFDVVVCFETIEHVDGQSAALVELKRVLKADGVLLISTPNREVYSERYSYQNPFHVYELSKTEFESELRHQFNFVEILPQYSTVASLIAKNTYLGGAASEPTLLSSPAVMSTDLANALSLDQADPIYFIAICSTAPSSPVSGLYFNIADSTLFDDEMLLRQHLASHPADRSLLQALLRLLDANRAADQRARFDQHTIAELKVALLKSEFDKNAAVRDHADLSSKLRLRDSQGRHAEAERISEQDRLLRAFAGLQNEHKSLWRKFEDSEQKLQSERERVAGAEQRLRDIETSTSWRMLGRMRSFMASKPRLRRMARRIIAQSEGQA
jgi:ubiquinone/menaquinone biosynthesis C-methylase UbiE